jgi:hypothetical protein
MRTKTPSEQAGDAVARWRYEQLVASGFSRPTADRVADDARFDLHALIELVESGCRPELAIRILAPLEDEPA